MGHIIKKIFLLSLVTVVVACENENDAPVAPAGDGSAAVCYVLNSGDWKSANSSLTMYDVATGAAEQGCFESQNNRRLGNTANDIVVYGSKMYIAVSGESTIEVASLDAKAIKQIECTVSL